MPDGLVVGFSSSINAVRVPFRPSSALTRTNNGRQSDSRLCRNAKAITYPRLVDLKQKELAWFEKLDQQEIREKRWEKKDESVEGGNV